MQKKLIALAVAGLVSGAASAQTAVTVYGIADVSFDSVSTSGGAVAGAKTGSYTRVSSNSSYIGFKGTEDLGNGLKALFQFETGVNADNSASMFGSTRDSFAGLEGAFGNIKLGTLTTPTRALGTQIDVNAGATSIGANASIIDAVAQYGVLAPAGTMGNDVRHGNTVQYSTPNFSGFNVAAAYISGENKTQDSVAAKQDASGWDLGLNYNNGPILVGVTYLQAKARDVVDNQQKNARVAAAYDFGMASVRVLWNSLKIEDSTGSDKQNAWGLGGTFNAAPNGKILAQYYKSNNWNGTSDTSSKLFELGYEHSFSKRTMLKVIYARINNDDGIAYNLNNGVRNVSMVPATATLGVDPSGFQVGIRHAF